MGRVDAIAQSMAEAHALSTVEIPPMKERVSPEEWAARRQVDPAAITGTVEAATLRPVPPSNGGL